MDGEHHAHKASCCACETMLTQPRARAGRAWMVNTMPTKPAVSSATPSERGPTSFSCSTVLRRWTLPARPRRPSAGSQREPRVSQGGLQQTAQETHATFLPALRRHGSCRKRRHAALQLLLKDQYSAMAPCEAECCHEWDLVQAEARKTAQEKTGRGLGTPHLVKYGSRTGRRAPLRQGTATSTWPAWRA